MSIKKFEAKCVVKIEKDGGKLMHLVFDLENLKSETLDSFILDMLSTLYENDEEKEFDVEWGYEIEKFDVTSKRVFKT